MIGDNYTTVRRCINNILLVVIWILLASVIIVMCVFRKDMTLLGFQRFDYEILYHT
jgi:hypothetical protein